MTEPITESVADIVRAELARRRIPHRQLADALGLTPISMSRRLNGSVTIDVVELEAIATFLHVPVATLLPEPASA